MTRRNNLMMTCAAMAAILASTPALAQTTPTAPSAGTDDGTVVVVTGLRKSLQNATAIKRNAAQVVDSIVAEDVGKMPDANIAELLQRIPGVQIARNTRGEGNAYVVHGLKQVLTTMNGRLLFTTTNRTANLLDWSSDILSGVDVYKTPTADQIEGGLGGLIDVHFARPFDYKGFHGAATVTGAVSDIHESVTPRLSGVVSNRWNTSVGEMGLLVGLQYEEYNSGGYSSGTNAYADRTDIIDKDKDGVFGTDPDDKITAPTQPRLQYERGERTRYAVYSSGQWRPNADLTLYTDMFFSLSRGRSMTQQLQVRTAAADGGTPVASSYTFKDGSTIPASFTYNNARVQSITAGTDNPYRTYMVAFGGKWVKGNLTTSGEAALTLSRGPFYSHNITLETRAPSATVALNSPTPNITVTGVNLNDPASWKYVGASDTGNQARGGEFSSRLDFKYELGDGVFKNVSAGLRYVHHKATADSWGQSYPSSGVGTALLPGLASSLSRSSPNDLFSDQDVGTNQWLVIDHNVIQDIKLYRGVLGLPIANPAPNPTSHYDFDEKVSAIYLQTSYGFDLGAVPIDGNIGVRYVKTEAEQKTFQPSTVSGGAPVPVTGGNDYNNLLPSINIRAKFTPDLFLRLAFSKALTRPDYSDLSPAATLSATSLSGSGGNPNLNPIQADQYDASLEYYFGKSNSAALSLFQKNVEGFVYSVTAEEMINGQAYQVRRPRNSGSGKIKGFELSYQQFFDFLPAPFDGLGFQGNYTYVDSKLKNPSLSYEVPAELLSKDSYNATAIYEKGPLSMHMSYNWRSKSVLTTLGDSANRPVYRAPYKSLDFSATYHLTDRVSVKADFVNMLYSYEDRYYGSTLLPTLSNQLDRSMQFGIHYNF